MMDSTLPAASPREEVTPGIGVFDSGVGGLTVLRALRSALPDAPLHYVADSGHAPYGPKSTEAIVARCLAIGEHLITHGAALIVVACNTATAHAVAALRARWPALPIVGIEPGIKPAVQATRNGRVAVMATQATVNSERYRQLIATHGGVVHVHSQACPGLVDRIETGNLEDQRLQDLLKTYTDAVKASGADTVLLGCTHYPFIQARIERLLGPEVTVLNTEGAVARQALKRWSELGLPSVQPASVRLESTGDPAPLARLATLALQSPQTARQVDI
ncbi:glutamate racemase [Mitsuaria sp. WAJ17]|uniref:glutamate racemase n=1 Tax=Mitsuaria sp. WAJ17 TaxID=2761452 RepID=UPI00210809BE|nr:glutamate racemase [Mitsuaria sp. WAJ17]